MTENIKKFLSRDDLQEIIDLEDWTTLYETCPSWLRGEFTQALMEAGLEEPWNAVNHVYRNMFAVNTAVDTVKLRKKNCVVEMYAFAHADVKHVIYNHSTAPIEKGTFSASSVQTVIGCAATEILHNAFQECDELEVYDGMRYATLIGARAFYGCSALRDVDLTGSPSILQEAFVGCKSLTTLETNAYCIQDNAFRRCTALNEIIIHNKNILLGASVFAFCPATEVRFMGTTAEWYACNKSTRWADSSNIEKVVCSNGVVKVQKH